MSLFFTLTLEATSAAGHRGVEGAHEGTDSSSHGQSVSGGSCFQRWLSAPPLPPGGGVGPVARMCC